MNKQFYAVDNSTMEVISLLDDLKLTTYRVAEVSESTHKDIQRAWQDDKDFFIKEEDILK